MRLHDDNSANSVSFASSGENSVTKVVFQMDGYIDGGNGNDWHYVWLTNPSCDKENYLWHNKAGKTWSLKAIKENNLIKKFTVGEDCPYF